MSKEWMAGAIKVGFAQMGGDYTETVFDGSICIETYGESQYPALEKYHVLSKCIALTPILWGSLSFRKRVRASDLRRRCKSQAKGM